MNKRVKTRWVKALRSGKYPQGKHTLRPGGFWCCLGVLCDVAAHSKKAGKPVIDSITEIDGSTHYDGKRYTLPSTVVRWAGLESDDPRVSFANNGEKRLSWINDQGYDFDTIADVIEKQL